MRDFAPTTGRTPIKGKRTKSAMRRARIRSERHAHNEKTAKRDSKKLKMADSKRREQGWWPPVPLSGPPPVYAPPAPQGKYRGGDGVRDGDGFEA